MIDKTKHKREYDAEDLAYIAYFEDRYDVCVVVCEPSDVDVDVEADVRSKTE